MPSAFCGQPFFHAAAISRAGFSVIFWSCTKLAPAQFLARSASPQLMPIQQRPSADSATKSLPPVKSCTPQTSVRFLPRAARVVVWVMTFMAVSLCRGNRLCKNLHMKKDKIEQFFARLQAQNPEPKGELNYTNPYTLLVAVTLSAQATDTGVNKATEKLFKIVKTPKDMLKLGEDGLKQHIKTIGLFNSKAKNVILAAEMLDRDFGGK